MWSGMALHASEQFCSISFLISLFIKFFLQSTIMLPAHAAGYLTQALNHLSLHRQRPWHHAGVMSSSSLTARQQTNLTIHCPYPCFFPQLTLIRLVKQVAECKPGNSSALMLFLPILHPFWVFAIMTLQILPSALYKYLQYCIWHSCWSQDGINSKPHVWVWLKPVKRTFFR